MKVFSLFLLIKVGIFACGPNFPSPVLNVKDERLLRSPRANFSAELRNMEDPRIVIGWQALERRTTSPHTQSKRKSRNTVLVDLQTLEQALLREGRHTADHLIKTYRKLRERLENFRIENEEAQAILKDYLSLWKGERNIPWYVQRRWRKAGYDPRSDVQPLQIPIELPAELPLEFSLYFKGAHAFHSGNTQAAQTYWNSLLELPTNQRTHRGTWAAFMLGRLNKDVHPDKARRYFSIVKDERQEGRKDPLGLFSASLGWEAWMKRKEGALVESLQIYLEQWAEGNTQALISISWVLDDILKGNHFEGITEDPLLIDLMNAHLLSMGPKADVTTWEPWIHVLKKMSPGIRSGAHRLAWLCYRQGAFGQSREWLKFSKNDLAITHWIRAKLTLRDGQVDQGIHHLKNALAQLKSQVGHKVGQPFQSVICNSGYCIRGELGSLLYGKDRYEESMTQLLIGGFWQDAAHIAELVLTIDELKSYCSTLSKQNIHSSLIIKLRSLLARRLHRSMRFKEAEAFFSAKVLPTFFEYRKALKDGRNFQQLNRSDLIISRWKAAELSRHQGLAILGYELAPDWNLYGGRFDLGSHKTPSLLAGFSMASERTRQRILKHQPTYLQRHHHRYIALEHAKGAIALMPDNDPLTADMIMVAANWVKHKDPKAADPFYKDLVNRCKKLPIGQQADRLRWFPKVPIPEDSILGRLMTSNSLP